MKKLLIANRGEIAIRVASAAHDLGIVCVAVYSADDARSLHRLRADEAIALNGAGPAAYLDMEQLVGAARKAGCDALHPGYGFLSESASFARRVAEQGIIFVGPAPGVLDTFGDKGAARALAMKCGVPIPHGTSADTTLEEARSVFDRCAAGVMVKAIAGGGGRGMRKVTDRAELASAMDACRAEARLAFGTGSVYVEELMTHARHIEVQVLADAAGGVVVLGERECSLQRRHQKVIEIAPAPGLDAGIRAAMADAARMLANAAGLQGLGTFEFLVKGEGSAARWLFLECNPRLQVEHTVTEAVFGLDLVQAQLQVAAGRTLAELRLQQNEIPLPSGYAVELRINMERFVGREVQAASGTLSSFEPPSGPGIRVDTHGYAGFTPSPLFDSLLAKLVVHAPRADLLAVLARAARALSEFRIEGVPTNKALLQALLAHPAVQAFNVSTEFLAENLDTLLEVRAAREKHFEAASAVNLGCDETAPTAELASGLVAIRAPMGGSVLEMNAHIGDGVSSSQCIATIEAMKMHNEVSAGVDGVVERVLVALGEVVVQGAVLFLVAPSEPGEASRESDQSAVSPDHLPLALSEVLARRAATLDLQRPAAVAKRHATQRLTARENIAALCDEGSFMEVGSLVVSGMRNRDPEDLRAMSPADGLVAGLAAINGLTQARARCAVIAFDTTVFAGTMGVVARGKIERVARLAGEGRMPLVMFAEGGGARSGESDDGSARGSLETFLQVARLKGKVPLVGIAAGNCFAANAALLGLCDIVIATPAASIGMAGPPMIEGAGLGVCRPQDVGPALLHARRGVVTILVQDEQEAVSVAKRCVGFFQGDAPAGVSPDQRLLRHVIPANRLVAYDIRAVLQTLADDGSTVELRAPYGRAMVTALVRIEGVCFGVMANDPRHLGGAIDAEAADKATSLLELCEAFRLPVLTLCDTPGFMVGPEAEKQGLVKQVMRMMVVGANVTVPHFSVVVRKCYGLGGLAMNLGSHTRPLLHLAWPSGEYGAMNPEGSVRLAYKRELAEIADPGARRQRELELIRKIQERGSALQAAARGAIDEIIDPADTRRWLLAGLSSARRQLSAGIRSHGEEPA